MNSTSVLSMSAEYFNKLNVVPMTADARKQELKRILMNATYSPCFSGMDPTTNEVYLDMIPDLRNIVSEYVPPEPEEEEEKIFQELASKFDFAKFTHSDLRRVELLEGTVCHETNYPFTYYMCAGSKFVGICERLKDVWKRTGLSCEVHPKGIYPEQPYSRSLFAPGCKLIYESYEVDIGLYSHYYSRLPRLSHPLSRTSSAT